jgi:hypothetical protein
MAYERRAKAGLTFISFLSVVAIVLNDLASSAYYAGGIAEHEGAGKRNGFGFLEIGQPICDELPQASIAICRDRTHDGRLIDL